MLSIGILSVGMTPGFMVVLPASVEEKNATVAVGRDQAWPTPLSVQYKQSTEKSIQLISTFEEKKEIR